MNGLEGFIPESMVTAGIVLLAIEILVLGFATFILFFLGVSLVITGVLAWAGVLPVTWPALLLANALLTAILAGVLWRPLLKLQSKTEHTQTKSDFDGHRFFAPSAIDRKGTTRYTYSGIEWALKSEKPIAEGVEVEVVKAEVGALWVREVAE